MVYSVISKKIEIKDSNIHGKGMFATDIIKAGDVVFIKGGNILTKDEIYACSTINSYMPIDDNYFLGARNTDDELKVKLFNNHSCEPNCGLRGEITFVAIRDISKGEELTCDYAFIDNEDYHFECNCGSKSCRKIVTGFDWKNEAIQKKYGRFFASYLREKFESRG